jgi:hypothetical protein
MFKPNGLVHILTPVPRNVHSLYSLRCMLHDSCMKIEEEKKCLSRKTHTHPKASAVFQI